MKTLRKVCEMVGTTRKTLRGYDEIGLLHPTAKTENGYWLYDDEAIRKLRFIQIFADAGYERSTIKEILENPAADFGDEYDHVIQSLEKSYGVTLFHRDKRHLSLTAEGEQLFEAAGKLLHQTEYLKLFQGILHFFPEDCLCCLYQYMKLQHLKDLQRN